MNAAEQAKNVTLAGKIANLVTLFKTEFADARADLKPWVYDSDTEQFADPDSIDISFSFPGLHPACQCRCILFQIRFSANPLEQAARVIGLEARGFDHRGQCWRFSTIGQWQFCGDTTPSPLGAEKLRRFCQCVFDLF